MYLDYIKHHYINSILKSITIWLTTHFTVVRTMILLSYKSKRGGIFYEKVNRNILNAVLVGAGFVSSLLMINKNKVSTKSKPSLLFQGNAPYIFAHRGGMALRPEQTQLAFDYAKQLGVDGFETDVRLTKINSLSFSWRNCW